MKKEKKLLIVIAVFLVALALFATLGTLGTPQPPLERLVTVDQILSNPWLYSGRPVQVSGYLVQNVGAFWGETYDLVINNPLSGCESQGTPFCAPLKIALTGNINNSLVAYKFDGRDFSLVKDQQVIVIGTFRDQGIVTDAPRYYIEVTNLEPLKASI